MAEKITFPDTYHVVWLDAHIGNQDSCVQLKRAFFTHMDPESYQEVPLSDKDIDNLIDSNSSLPVTFDSFHFTLKAFVDVDACLQHIEEIKDHRILFISSSILGEPAVTVLLDKYVDSFTNRRTNRPYDSIYIFCSDFLVAARWAASYEEYVKIFDIETDLLTRMTRDLGDEFLDHGRQLLAAHQIEDAIERLSWAKSLFIRHDKLKFPSVPSQQEPFEAANGNRFISTKKPIPSTALKEIDQLLEHADTLIPRKRDEEEESEDESQLITDDLSTSTSAPTPATAIPDHLIVWLDPSILHGQNTESIHCNVDMLAELKSEMAICFSGVNPNIVSCNDINTYVQCTTGKSNDLVIYSIIPSSSIKTIIPALTKLGHPMKKLYVLLDSNDTNSYKESVDHGHTWKNLLRCILEDISEHYLMKGSIPNVASASPNTVSLIYLEWAKQTRIRAKRLADNRFDEDMTDIQKQMEPIKISPANKELTKDDSAGSLKPATLEDDSDSVVIIFVVGLETKAIDLDSGIGRLISCSSDSQLISDLHNCGQVTPVLLVSSAMPSHNILSLNQLLHYYYLPKVGGSLSCEFPYAENITKVYSIDHLMGELYHQLGQYYRNRAIEVSLDSGNQQKAKQLLEKSTQCYQLLNQDSEKTLKRYAEIMRKTPS